MLAAPIPDFSNSTIYGQCAVRAYDERYRKKVVQLDEYRREKEVSWAPCVYTADSKNVVLDLGRKTILRGLFNISTVTYFLYGCVGSGSSNPTDAAQDRLATELISGGPATRVAITDSAGGALDASDVVSASSGSNRWMIVVKYSYLTTEFVGDTFYEYGLNDTAAFPGTPTGLSGIMLCRFVAGSSFTKTSAFSVDIEWTLRS